MDSVKCLAGFHELEMLSHISINEVYKMKNDTGKYV